MGIHPAPSYAKLYLANRIDNYIKMLGEKYSENGVAGLKIFKRFLDDIFSIFIGSTKMLHRFVNKIKRKKYLRLFPWMFISLTYC